MRDEIAPFFEGLINLKVLRVLKMDLYITYASKSEKAKIDEILTHPNLLRIEEMELEFNDKNFYWNSLEFRAQKEKYHSKDVLYEFNLKK